MQRMLNRVPFCVLGGGGLITTQVPKGGSERCPRGCLVSLEDSWRVMRRRSEGPLYRLKWLSVGNIVILQSGPILEL